MAETLLVRVDLEAMAKNLSATDGVAWDVDKVRDWLANKHGLIEQADGAWLIEDLQLALFHSSEILSRRRA